MMAENIVGRATNNGIENVVHMKKILLVGKQLINIPLPDELEIKNAEYFAAADLSHVQQVFAKNNNVIDVVIMGGGIELEKRLEVVRYIFNVSNTTSVHMKDPGLQVLKVSCPSLMLS